MDWFLYDNSLRHERVKQPKCTGASWNWVNIETVGKEEPRSSVNWDEVLWRRDTESKQLLMLAAIKENSQEVLDGRERELNVFINLVEDHGQDSVSCRCVFTEKQKENGSKLLKAHLVAQGFA